MSDIAPVGLSAAPPPASALSIESPPALAIEEETRIFPGLLAELLPASGTPTSGEPPAEEHDPDALREGPPAPLPASLLFASAPPAPPPEVACGFQAFGASAATEETPSAGLSMTSAGAAIESRTEPPGPAPLVELSSTQTGPAARPSEAFDREVSWQASRLAAPPPGPSGAADSATAEFEGVAAMASAGMAAGGPAAAERAPVALAGVLKVRAPESAGAERVDPARASGSGPAQAPALIVESARSSAAGGAAATGVVAAEQLSRAASADPVAANEAAPRRPAVGDAPSSADAGTRVGTSNQLGRQRAEISPERADGNPPAGQRGAPLSPGQDADLPAGRSPGKAAAPAPARESSPERSPLDRLDSFGERASMTPADGPSRIAASQSGPAARQPASGQPARPELQTAERGAAPREISLVVSQRNGSGPNSEPVALRLVERAGQIHVTVRSADRRMVESLRRELPALTERLERAGFQSLLWRPVSEAVARGAEPEGGREVSSDPGRGYSDQGGQHGGAEQDARQRRAPEAWLEALASGPGAEIFRRFEDGFIR